MLANPTSHKVSLLSPVQQIKVDVAPIRFPTTTAIPITVLGAERYETLGQVTNVKPTPNTFFGPRGMCVLENGQFWVSDTGHHRLLGWKTIPHDGQPADWVIGQKDFYTEGKNARNSSEVHPHCRLVMPTCIDASNGMMVVADAWNHRVLLWRSEITQNNTPPDVVLSFPQSSHVCASMHWPFGVCIHNHTLFVADSKNRRVLVWHALPQIHNDTLPSIVLGQEHFMKIDNNAGGDPTACSMSWPHSICIWQERLCLADSANNRIMVWNGIPTQNNEPCAFILGQPNFTSVDINQTHYQPTPASVNMPYALDADHEWLFVADTANSRLLAWHCSFLATGANAQSLYGQPDFFSKGDNTWHAMAENTLCWPYGLRVKRHWLMIADSGNNRIVLFKTLHD